jgi:hypothetical protein
MFCGMLFKHTQILMHNELFNQNAVHTYYKCLISDGLWDYEARDVYPDKFLTAMFEGHRKVFPIPGKGKIACKAVGYKSFPDHYMEFDNPSALLQEMFTGLMEDLDVKKIILMRDNVFQVYVSQRRAKQTGAYMTTNYDGVKLNIDIEQLQIFVDAYQECYRAYADQTHGQRACYITFEELKNSRESTMRKVLRYLDVDQEDLTPLNECVPQSSDSLHQSIENYAEVEFAFRHTQWGQRYLPPVPASVAAEAANTISVVDSCVAVAAYSWALLIPVKGSDVDAGDECRKLLTDLRDSIIETTTPEDRELLTLVFGIDKQDTLYDTDAADSWTPFDEGRFEVQAEGGQVQGLLRDIFQGQGFHINFARFEGLEGQICKIWKNLAELAYSKFDVDFTVLLGDDVVLRDGGWKSKIESTFELLAQERQLPFGAACVAFNDRSFPGFPTFPVVHKFHFIAFPNEFLSPRLNNQGGDPFLFELYKRFGASRVAETCSLENRIGGMNDARYIKNRVRFEGDILSVALQRLEVVLGSEHRSVPCIDVVVPTYRCDVSLLKKITSMRASLALHAQVSFWIILDNPDSPHAKEVTAMQSVASNYQINVRHYDKNRGASYARNYGLGCSYADWVILLDDDVTPEPSLLDAYIGATFRYPCAAVLVGSTPLPEPCNLLTHAIRASGIPGAFTIAERQKSPAWGVTANLCVRGRTSRIRFQLQYPKTGGGEDLDFCIRAGHHGPIKAVPGAKAHHPWWCNGEVGAIWHILGWAAGESLCVGAKYLQPHVYFTCPNGVEFGMLLGLLVFPLANSAGMPVRFAACSGSVLSVLALETMWHCHTPFWNRRHSSVKIAGYHLLVSVGAAWLIMLQESARFIAHASRGALSNLFHRFDWHCGQAPQLVSAAKWSSAIRSASYIVITCWWCVPERLQVVW